LHLTFGPSLSVPQSQMLKIAQLFLRVCSIKTNKYKPNLRAKQGCEWWVGWIEEVPGVNCQEKTHQKLKESLAITLREALEFNRQDALSSAGTGYTEEKIATIKKTFSHLPINSIPVSNTIRLRSSFFATPNGVVIKKSNGFSPFGGLR